MDPAQAYDAVMGPKETQSRKVWDNPQAQGWLKDAFVNADKAQRQTLFDQLHKAMLEDVPMLMLFNAADEFAQSDRVSGYKSWAAGKERLWGVKLTH